MIVVATENFELYHEVVTELRPRGAAFTTVEPGDAIPDDAGVLLAGVDDDVDAEMPVVRADPDAPRPAVEEALEEHRGG